MKVTAFLCSFLLTLTIATLPASELRADEWPQWRGPNRNGVWSEEGILDRFESDAIKVKWRRPIGSGYTGPTVADGRVYVSDRVVQPEQLERVHCFDWRDGSPLWSHSYACPYEGFGYTAGPRASAIVDEGRVYHLGAAGHLLCLVADKGAVVWQRDLAADYEIRMPNWGISAAPLIEDDLLIVQVGGAEDACVVALDKRTGNERWTALEDDVSYSAPIVVHQQGTRVLVVWTGMRIVGLKPTSGELLWEFPFPWEKWPIGIATPVIHDDLLLVSESHKGSLLLRMGASGTRIEKVWHRRKENVDDGKALHCLISTPFIAGHHIYGADSSGVLRCLELGTGKQVWEDRTAVPENRWATIHLTPHGERTWLFNERGELIIARLTPAGFDEISRARLLDPTTDQLRRRDGVTWSHPAYAYQHIFARNDKEIVCADLRAR